MPERKGHAKEEVPYDQFLTTPSLADLLTAKAAEWMPDPQNVFEPGAGAGSFMGAAIRRWPGAKVEGIEIQDKWIEYAKSLGYKVLKGDLSTVHKPYPPGTVNELGSFDLILGNPPFDLLDKLVPVLLSMRGKGGVVALLLRIGWMAGQKRYESLWRIFPPSGVYPLPARPGFTSDGGTDATDYAFYVWQEGYAGKTVLEWIDNRQTANKWDGTREVYPVVDAVEDKGSERVLPQHL